MNQPKKIALIIGAGPAGLTAALELLRHTDIHPMVFEASGDIGGLAKTVTYHENKIDIGGHRFFSKSDRVLAWWNEILPLQAIREETEVTYHHQKKKLKVDTHGPDPEKDDTVMLLRKRVSRIFFKHHFFDYPLSLSWKTIRNFGIWPTYQILGSYMYARVKPVEPEVTLEDFYVNRFGKQLYRTFFKDYTEKVWGVPCHMIPAEWGKQRVKGLSISKAIQNGLRKFFFRDKSLSQEKTHTSLIEQFLYPKYGPGQMWEEVARQVTAAGGEVLLHQEVVGMRREENRIVEIQVRNTQNQELHTYQGEYVFSSMPVKELIAGLNQDAPQQVQDVAQGLVYRDFITVGLLLKKLNIEKNKTIPDNWLYIQDKDVLVGRIQIFNNWSPYIVKDPSKVWIGLEYFCTEGDGVWNSSDQAMKDLAQQELIKLGMILTEDVLDSTVVRVKKSYPCYFGTYDQFSVIREFTDKIENLFLIGRNGMHRYNNQDHSMLTAMTAVENILHNIKTKDNLWSINLDDDYHEEK